jgi:hypothetical protein
MGRIDGESESGLGTGSSEFDHRAFRGDERHQARGTYMG